MKRELSRGEKVINVQIKAQNQASDELRKLSVDADDLTQRRNRTSREPDWRPSRRTFDFETNYWYTPIA